MIKLKAPQIEWFVALCLFVLMYTLTEGSGQTAIIIGASIIAFFIIAFLHNGTFRFKLNGYFIYLIAFGAFIYLSALWAENSSLAISKGNVLILQIFVLMVVFYFVFSEKKDIRSLLRLIQWGGYIILAYAVLRFGMSSFIYAIQNEERVSGAYMNANMLGMCAAYSVVINVYFMVYEKLRITDLLIIPAVIVIAATGSRKALIILILGVFAVFILRNIHNRQFVMSLIRVLAVIVALAIILILLSRLSIFSGVSKRMSDLFTVLSGEGTRATSGWLRMQYNQLGMQIFGQHPIIGIGMDNAKIYALSTYGYYHYLHDNYVELAADGGIIGFVLYYSIYAYILYTMIKYRSERDQEWDISMILLVIRLIMDYGCVSYETRGTYVFLLLFWLEAQKLKNESRKKTQTAVDNNSDNLCRKGYY